jgi:hypothetical protein
MGWQSSWAVRTAGAQTLVLATLAWAGGPDRVPSARAQLVTEIEPARVVRPRPRFTTLAPVLAREGQTYRYAANVQDPDREEVAFTLVRAPEGAALEGRVLVWVPTHAQAHGRQRFTLRAVDERGEAREQSWAVLARPGPRTLRQLRQTRRRVWTAE